MHIPLPTSSLASMKLPPPPVTSPGATRSAGVSPLAPRNPFTPPARMAPMTAGGWGGGGTGQVVSGLGLRQAPMTVAGAGPTMAAWTEATMRPDFNPYFPPLPEQVMLGGGMTPMTGMDMAMVDGGPMPVMDGFFGPPQFTPQQLQGLTEHEIEMAGL